MLAGCASLILDEYVVGALIHLVMYALFLKDRLQISLLILSEFKRINFYSPWDHQKTYGVLIISGG